MPKNLASQTPLSVALREARRSRGLTQAELAERAGIGERTAHALESGKGNVATFGKALAALGLVLCFRNAAGELPEVIRTLRERRGLSQRGLAGLAKVSQPTIGKLEQPAGGGQFAPLERVLSTLGAGAYLAPADRPKPFYTHAGNASVGMSWETPSDLLEKLYGVFGGFDLDPCSPRRDGPVKAKVRFTAQDDGLSLPWNGRVFANPPYGRGLGNWTAKAWGEHERGNATLAVLLIPARTDTSYFHRDILGRADVLFIKGRLRFGGVSQAAPFPSMLACYGASDGHLKALSEVL